jgi:hypothetical protein
MLLYVIGFSLGFLTLVYYVALYVIGFSLGFLA